MIKVEYTPPTKWLERSKWTILEKYESHGGVFIPEGFVTDGATVPWPLTSFVSPTGKLFPAAIVHDYYLHEGYGWKVANMAFDEEMKHCNISNTKRRLIYWAVSAYAAIKQLRE